jgi:glycerol uptake facilitator-like aquaporin
MISYFVEFLGSAFLVYVFFAASKYLAFANGLALAIATILGGPISGGAFNPAVAITLYSAGRIGKVDVCAYILAETIGGLLGYFLYKNLVM